MIKLYYSSKSTIGKQTLGYLEASYKDLLAIDVTKSNVTGTQWKEIAERLGYTISDLVDQQHPVFSNTYESESQIDENGWIKILNTNPQVLNYPIVILGNHYYQIKNPSDIERLLKPNSKGIDEKKHI